MEALKEMLEFLNLDARLDLKAIALEHVLGVTGRPDGRGLLVQLPDLLKRLVGLMRDSSSVICKDAALALVNLTADEAGTEALLIISESCEADTKEDLNLIRICLGSILDKDSPLADPCCMILSNATRPLRFVDRVVTLVEASEYAWDSLVQAFTACQYNRTGAKLHYLGPVFSNLSQSRHVRRFLIDGENGSVIRRLLPFTEYSESVVRRGGVVGTLKNCCFEEDRHECLLGPEIDILPYLLLPLAGPEEFDDEDNDKLPIVLQYLPETKCREVDVDIRIMLIESLGQLCTTKRGRVILREKNTYVILREYHKWETNRKAILACENVVDVLIRTEDEIGLDNLKDVEIPTEYEEKFLKMDRDFITDT